jgi:RNA polymerase sigma-70 factor, ECF subfamily
MLLVRIFVCLRSTGYNRPQPDLKIQGDFLFRGRMSEEKEISQLLNAFEEGNREVVDRMLPQVYSELRRIAGAYFRSEAAGQTLQPTALVNEAYFRLIAQRDVRYQNRAHFVGVAAQIMRRILVDYARRRHAGKRGAGWRKVSLEEIPEFPKGGINLIALDEALQRLSQVDARQSRIVEMRYFGGLSMEEVADVLGISTVTVKRDWSFAKAWLHRELKRKK